MQKDDVMRQAIQEEINSLGLGEKSSKQYSLDELSKSAPVLTKEILLAVAHVNNVTDKDKLIDPPKAVELNTQQGRSGKFGMGYGGTLKFDVDGFNKIDMPELRTILQHELGHHAEFVSRPAGYLQPSIKNSSDQSQVNEVKNYYYTKEFQADWYADALTGVYSHLKAVQRKPESYVPVEQSPDHPDRRSRIAAMVSELYVAGSEKNDMPQSGNVADIVANRTKSSPEIKSQIDSKMMDLDRLVKAGLTDASIDQFVAGLEKTSKQLSGVRAKADVESTDQGNQGRLALASAYMLNPSALQHMAAHDDLAPLYVKRQMLLNEALSTPVHGNDRLRLEVAVESRFDVVAYQQIVAGRVKGLEVYDSATVSMQDRTAG